MKAKSFLDKSDQNELSEILTRERLKTANVKAPPKRAGAAADPDLEEIFEHVRKAENWQGPKKKLKNKNAVRKLAAR